MDRPTIFRFGSWNSPIFNGKIGRAASISTFPAQVAARAAAGAFAFARSSLARKHQNIPAMPTNSPKYRAQERPKRPREPPAGVDTAPIANQSLNSRRERQKAEAATA